MYDNRKIGENPSIKYYNAGGKDMVRVPYEIKEISPGVYSWREISVKHMDFNYNGLVSALIGLKYSDANMTAIINNYLLDSNDEDYTKEFNEMQEYRKYAKHLAKQILGNN